MKQIKECLVCGRPVPLALAYQANIDKVISNPITGEITLAPLEGHICPKCNKTMGYKTSKDKLAKFTEDQNENTSTE